MELLEHGVYFNLFTFDKIKVFNHLS